MNRRIYRYRRNTGWTSARSKYTVAAHFRRLRRRFWLEQATAAYILSDDFEPLTVNDGWNL